MSIDLSVRLVDEATSLLRAGETLPAVLDRVTKMAAEDLPSPVWEALGAIDPAVDVTGTTAWLLRQIESRPPPDDLSALWLGLYEVRGPGPGRTEVFMAVSGAPGFPAPEWLSAKNWDPPGYAPAPGLRSLLPLAAAAPPEVRDVVRSAVVLSYGMGLTAAVLDAVDPGSVLAGRPELGVATGFSDGNIALVGVLTPSGLDRSRLAEA